MTNDKNKTIIFHVVSIIQQTDDAEIKIRSALTASLGGEKQAESSLLNGPQRVQSKVKCSFLPSILQRRARVSCREYDGIPYKV